ncbi:MAG: DUF1638 domain-containing protein [Desulfoferrobacter sp.]
MKKRISLVACKIFEKELITTLPPDEDVEVVWIDAALHADLPKLEKELAGALSADRLSDRDVRILFGSGCHPDMCQLARRFGAGLAPVKNCIEAFCGLRTKELEANRTMVMTPGWIRAWPDIMKALGWDEVDARINLGIYDRILLLDPGVDPLSEDEILAFFDMTQVPVEMEVLDLSHFKATLEKILKF